MAKNTRHSELVSESQNIETPYELPEGWKWCRLGELCEKIKRGKSPKYTDKSKTLVFAQKCNQPDGTMSLEKALFLNEELLSKYKDDDFVKDGDILINSTGTGTIGRVGYFDKKLLPEGMKLVSDTHVTTVRACINNAPKFFYYFIKQKESYLELKGVGTTNMKELHADVLENLPFPLPPTLAEQQRIVKRIETMFAKLDQAQEKAQSVLDSFETRKAAILHKAFTGELTANWRKENGVSDESWEEKTLQECGNIFGGGTPSMSHKEYWESGNILWITSKDMKSDLIEKSEMYTNELGVENSAAKYIKDPAVLFVMRSGILRRTFPVCMVKKPFTVNQDLKALIPNGFIMLEYLFYACKSNERKILDTCMKNGTTVESINAPALFNVAIKVPTLPEQQEIVRILDTILEKERTAKEAAEQVLEQIDLLQKSILARAFSGNF